REMPPATLLQQLIRQREASYEQIARDLEDFARREGIDGTIGVRHVQRLARHERGNGGGAPSALPGTRRLLREFFGYAFDELIGPPRIETAAAPIIVPATSDMSRIVRDASADSLDFLSWAENDRVAPAVLEHIASELRRIAIEYVHR